ncbi:hypothetical protein QYF61_001064 [Mycteria americana]|uniref:Uncharacterized protein n=1 Tax=Mycteria americana TaxID=33587 RepID=A0AAN7MKZ0_MYCAM|nr:hypothetical protein QYF61_001064 [Mycteria americana]
MVKTMVRQVVPLQPMEVHSRADIHPAACGGPHAKASGCALKEAAACGEPMLEQAPGRNCGLCRGAHAGACFQAGPVTPWGPFLKDCTLWKGPMLEQFLKNCSPWEGPTLEKVVEDCLPWEGPHAGAGEECEEEGAAETKCDELIATPIPHPPHTSIFQSFRLTLHNEHTSTSVFNSQTSYPQGIQPPELEDRNGEQNKPPIIEEEAVNDLLRHLDTHKSMGPDRIHPRVLRELARSPSTRRAGRRIRGITGLSA